MKWHKTESNGKPYHELCISCSESQIYLYIMGVYVCTYGLNQTITVYPTKDKQSSIDLRKNKDGQERGFRFWSYDACQENF